MHRMNLIRQAQSWNYHSRRIQVLAQVASDLIPQNSRVLDIGCGDGKIDRKILNSRPDVLVQGCDLVSWPNQEIDVMINEGLPLPFDDQAFDCALLIDVIHHAEDPSLLLNEAIRTTAKYVIIKDHLTDPFLALPFLQFMDRSGNEEQGVSNPYKYWSKKEWMHEFRVSGLELDSWFTDIPIYPWWATWLFGRGLHFIARLSIG